MRVWPLLLILALIFPVNAITPGTEYYCCEYVIDGEGRFDAEDFNRECPNFNLTVEECVEVNKGWLEGVKEWEELQNGQGQDESPDHLIHILIVGGILGVIAWFIMHRKKK